jgi:hypothetical protein
MLKINQHTTKLSKALLTAGLLGGAAVATFGAGSAQAAQETVSCSFGGSIAHPLCSSINWSTGWTLGDKTLTNLTYFPGIGPTDAPPTGTFSFIWDDFGPVGVDLTDMYSTLATFDPSLPEPSTGSYSYDLSIDPVLGAGWTFGTAELDVNHTGTGQNVQKLVKDALGTPIATLTSLNGMPDGPVPISGTTINVTDSWSLDPTTGTISSISNSYTQVPAPLPILGAGVALGSIRKLRKFSSRLKTFSMG